MASYLSFPKCLPWPNCKEGIDMVKGNGHSRTYTPDTQQFSDRKAEYITKLASCEFDTNKSYFSEIGGGNVLYMKDRRYKEDEMQAAKAIEKLEVNIGQLDGLPQNPRIIKDRESTKKQGAKILEINLVTTIH